MDGPQPIEPSTEDLYLNVETVKLPVGHEDFQFAPRPPPIVYG